MAPNDRSPNYQRSDAKNSTSAEHKAALDNYSRQMNPKDATYHRSRDHK